MPNREPYRLERDMALTHAEFLRSLPNAAPGMKLEKTDGVIQLYDPPRRLRIELGPERRHRLGSLTLPRTSIRLLFEGFSETERTAFLERFDLAYRRGGG